MRRSLRFTVLAAMLLVLLGALLFSLASCEEEPAEKFSVNFIVDGAEYASIATAGEERISIPVSPYKPHYTFGGWYRDKDVWGDRFTSESLVNEKLTANISVYAKLVPIEYKATFKDGGTVVAEIPFTVETESITLPAVPEHAGYTGAWEDFTLGTENITVNAVYTAIPYTITYNNVDGATNSNPETYTVEDRIVLANAKKSGFVFMGWYFDSAFNNRVAEIPGSGMVNVQLYAKWGEGTEISTADELKNISMIGHYVLIDDIDLGGMEWPPIGTMSSPFAGVFDGNGYKITNFKISIGAPRVGLFVGNSGTIQNLGVENFEIDVTYSDDVYAGGLVGYNSGEITNCYATGDVSATSSSSSYSYSYSYAGGLVGYNYKGTITNCYATGTVSATSSSSDRYSYSPSSAGGLVGDNSDGTITNCYATGDVSATSSRSGSSIAGGLVGSNWSGTITNCYATGDVSGSSSVGGLVGYNGGTITNCYRYSGQSFTVDKNGTVSNSATNTEGTEKTMEELKSSNFQTDTLGWSADDWNFTEGAHPVLKNVGLA